MSQVFPMNMGELSVILEVIKWQIPQYYRFVQFRFGLLQVRKVDSVHHLASVGGGHCKLLGIIPQSDALGVGGNGSPFCQLVAYPCNIC